jgi:hypothetical protein
MGQLSYGLFPAGTVIVQVTTEIDMALVVTPGDVAAELRLGNVPGNGILSTTPLGDFTAVAPNTGGTVHLFGTPYRLEDDSLVEVGFNGAIPQDGLPGEGMRVASRGYFDVPAPFNTTAALLAWRASLP